MHFWGVKTLLMSKRLNVLLWLIQIGAAVLFILIGGQKLLAVPDVVANFRRWGMPPLMYYVIGTFELLGAFGLLVPGTAGMAAVGLIIIMVGAIATHLTHGEYSMAPLPVTVLILLSLVAYFRDPLRIFGRRRIAAE